MSLASSCTDCSWSNSAGQKFCRRGSRCTASYIIQLSLFFLRLVDAISFCVLYFYIVNNSVNMAQRGQRETEKLRKTAEDQITRLVTQLADLEELREAINKLCIGINFYSVLACRIKHIFEAGVGGGRV